MILKILSLADLPNKDAPLYAHKAGLSYTASGYGNKIPTRNMVQLPGSKTWRRVYCCIHSNAGTCYVESGPKYKTEQGKIRRNWIVITD